MHQHLTAFFQSLRDAGHHLPLSDADAAQLIGDALDIVQPDDEDTANAAAYMANSFHMVAEDYRAAAT